jgi:hypothetical protein
MDVNLVIQYVIKNYKNYISKKKRKYKEIYWIKKFIFSEKRIKMKKDQDPIERLAFHLITYRDVALNVANDGLRCEQLSFPIDKYLGKFFMNKIYLD